MQSTPEDIMKTFQVAIVGPVLLLQTAYEHMPRNSRVINIGSVASKMGFVQMPIYGAAKAAMDQLTFTLSREVSFSIDIDFLLGLFDEELLSLTHIDWPRW